MGLSDIFIRRPIMTTLVMLSILLFGIVAYRNLPVSDLPNVDRPTIQISAACPGASPDTMASSVATVLEKEFSQIAGIESMSSASSQGSTSVTLQFSMDRNIDSAAQDVQAAISRVSRRMPAGMTTPPTYRKVNPADMPIMMLALTSPTLPMYMLDEFGQTNMAQRISMVDGVSQVQVWGTQKYAVRIQLDPQALAYRSIGIDEVASAISQQNVSLALGSISGPRQSMVIQDNGQLLQAQKYASLVVAYRNGRPVRLDKLGTIEDSVENDQTAAWYFARHDSDNPQSDGKLEQAIFQPAIILAIMRQPGTNTVDVADAVKKLLPEFKAQLPGAVRLDMLRDNSVTIRNSAEDVQFTLLLTLVLVVLVIFLFLRNLSATLIPSLVLPMSIIGTFIVMYLMGYSLDNLSLMALTLSVGFVVDDAIVMLENVVRHLEMGKSRMEAALMGSREIGFTIVSMTISLAAVFIPVLFMSGMTGRLFREFAVTIGAAVLVSGVVSLSLTPMLCSRFLREHHQIRHGLAYRITEAGFQAMLKAYQWSLAKALKFRLVTMTIALGILGGTVYLGYIMPMGFIPSEDRDWVQVRAEGGQDISFDSMVAHMRSVADIVKDDPNVERFMTHINPGSGGMFIILKPRAERTVSADGWIAYMRPKLSVIPGVTISLSNPPPINIGSRTSRGLYQYTLQGAETEQMYAYAAELEGRLREQPGFLDVNTDMKLQNPQLQVNIDRDRALTFGVTPLQIETALSSAYGTRQISTMMTPTNQYQVIMELLPQYQRYPDTLKLLQIRSSSGQMVPLSTVASLSQDVGPLTINHTGQMPSVTVSFNLDPSMPLSVAKDTLMEITRQTMPDTMTIKAQGTAQESDKSISSMGWLLVLAIVVIYVVLGILYEDFLHPLTILSALPFAGFGALLTLMIFKMDLSLYAFVGVIMLVGLVKKNGIMMIDFAIQTQRTEGKSPRDAIYEACNIRFRPIMMTTMAALMAGIPIAVGYGAGGESRKPLGLAVVGGLLFSQTLTLYVTPVFYLYMESLRKLLSRRRKTAAPQPLPVSTR